MVELGEQKAQALADALAHKKSLEEAAKAQGLTVQKSAPFARGELPPGLASPTLVARAFQLKQGEAEKEGFSLPQGAAFIALAEVQPARAPELKDVKERVRGELVEEAALAKAREDGGGAARQGRERRAREGGRGALARAQGDAVAHGPRPAARRPRHRPGARGGRFRAAGEDALGARARTPPGWALLRVLEKKPFDAAELERQKAGCARALREQRQSELFRAFLIAARDRYAISRNAAGVQARAGPGAVDSRGGGTCTSKSGRPRK